MIYLYFKNKSIKGHGFSSDKNFDYGYRPTYAYLYNGIGRVSYLDDQLS